MALVNHAKREINAKIVYYGGEGAGKQALLTYIHDRIKLSLRGELTTMRTGEDSLLFFDFSPFDKPVFEGYRLRFHLYTLPGRVVNPAAWRMTLKGADGVVIVADAAPEWAGESRETIQRLRDFFAAYGQGIDDLPCLLQLNWNGRAQRPATPVTAAELGIPGVPACCSDTASGEGILEAFSQLSREIMNRISAERSGWPSEQPAHDASDTTPPVSMSPHAPLETADETAAAASAAEGLRPEAGRTVSAGEEWLVAVDEGCVRCEGGVVMVPLEVTHHGAVCRVTISVALEPRVGNGQAG